MNFQFVPTSPPLRVLMVNPLAVASKLTIVKILSGYVFGRDQIIDLIILVYSNEKFSAEWLKLELIACAFACTNSIEVSSDLPSITDADVFCIITNFKNPNWLDFENIDIDEYFDTFYLILKIAYSLSKRIPTEEIEEGKGRKPIKTTSGMPDKKPKIRKPIIIADGVVAIDILKSLSSNIPPDVFFFPTSIPAIAKNILADYLKIKCNNINNVFVWAANDKALHVEIEQPMIITETIDTDLHCDKEIVYKNVLKSNNLDHTQFGASWMKKEFIEKICLMGYNNPYGNVFRAAKIGNTLKTIWKSRSSEDGIKIYSSMGVISDGSLGTIKGYPYVLPLVFEEDSWCINRRFEDDTHLKNEIKRINKMAKEHHAKLIPFCRKFLMENVDNKCATQNKDESYTVCLTLEPSSRRSSRT